MKSALAEPALQSCLLQTLCPVMAYYSSVARSPSSHPCCPRASSTAGMGGLCVQVRYLNLLSKHRPLQIPPHRLKAFSSGVRSAWGRQQRQNYLHCWCDIAELSQNGKYSLTCVYNDVSFGPNRRVKAYNLDFVFWYNVMVILLPSVASTGGKKEGIQSQAQGYFVCST